MIFVTACPVAAQFYGTQYRAPGQNWMEVNTDHFRLIFPERYQPEALHSLKILESEYADIQGVVGGELKNFPIILNPENDRSNGFVAPFNFRSEVELAPIKGKNLNPRSGDWLETVLPHELVHALHMSVNPKFSVTGVIGLLSKDFRRSVHGAAPAGLLEGIAVQHESHGTIPHSGRGNYPYFNHQFNALLGTDKEWSMGQLVHRSVYTLPFNRHYIGGYEFLNWLLNTYGDDTMRRAIRYHYKYPFLGFGMALRKTTGKYPKTLYREFSTQRKEEEQERLEQFEQKKPIAEEVPFSGTCRRMQRPLWLNDDTLLFYIQACNHPSGFYTWRPQDGKPELLKEVVITEDLYYSLSPERDQLLYSRYHSSRFYDNLQQGDLHRLHIPTGESERLTRNKRYFSPDVMGDGIAALQTEAHQQNLVLLDSSATETIREFPKPDSSTIIQAAANPSNRGQLAVIGKVKSVQGLWIAQTNDDSLFTRLPDIAFETGSVFDAAWHPSGENLLFVSDHSGAMNVYEYNLSEDEVRQVTNSRYNAFEASYSPDGRKIAYAEQAENEKRVYVMDRDEGLNQIIPPGTWTAGPEISKQFTRPLMNREEPAGQPDWNPQPYKSGLTWVKPRLWVPVIQREEGYDKIGLRAQSVDVLNSQAYTLEATHFADRFWFDFEYANKTFYPGFTLNIFKEPRLDYFPVQRNGGQERMLLLQHQRGASVSIPLNIRLESNSRFSSLLFEPEYTLSQVRFVNPASASETYSGFAVRHTLGVWNVLNVGLRQFTRDIQPNRGWIFFTDAQMDLNRDEISGGGGDFTLGGHFTRRRGIRAGISTFAAPLQKFNQSLRITLQAITQTDQPVFNTLSLYSDSFSETPMRGVNNAAILDTRYTIPLTYPDDGGFLVPLYLSNIYMVLFSQTAADLNQPDLIEGSRSVFGAGIRSRFRISNFTLDLGISIGWEPTRNEVTYRFGAE